MDQQHGGFLLDLINEVVANYAALIGAGDTVTKDNGDPAFQAITNGLPHLIQNWIPDDQRTGFESRGGVGQLNYHFAKIPWVVTYDPLITRSPQHAYYIALIFREDLQGFYVGLNVGFTQFKKQYGPASLAKAEAQRAAKYCAALLDLPGGFEVGSMDLAATGPTGKGYEVGSIASRYFPITNALTEDEVESAYLQALELYIALRAKLAGRDLLDVIPNDEQATLQAAVAKIGKEDTNLGKGAVTRPPRVGVNRSQWKRSAAVVAIAIERANYQCELDPGHETFAWRGRSHDFIEAHHLIPMSLQEDFLVSLDVPENVVALCPLCHRLFHSGKSADLRPLIKRLLKERSPGLLDREIEIDSRDLVRHYAKSLAEDD